MHIGLACAAALLSDPRSLDRRVEDPFFEPGVAIVKHAASQREVGVVAVMPKLIEPLLGPNPERKPRGAPSRWKPKADLEWSSVPPELVVEVRYDKWQKGRIRHNARFLRFRPDKDPDQCTWRQVRPPRRRGDPTVESLLAAPSS